MKEKIERWLAKKLKVKPDSIILKDITVNYDFVNPDTFDITPGKKTWKL